MVHESGWGSCRWCGALGTIRMISVIESQGTPGPRAGRKSIIEANHPCRIVKDQSVARLDRPDDDSSQEQTAMATQKALSIHPATLVHDQFRWANPHRQPARRTARTVRPRVRSEIGVAQWMVFHWPCRTATMSKSQIRMPAVSQPSSPRLPSTLGRAEQDDRSDQGHASGHRGEAGEQRVRRPGQAAALDQQAHSPRGSPRPPAARW